MASPKRSTRQSRCKPPAPSRGDVSYDSSAFLRASLSRAILQLQYLSAFPPLACTFVLSIDFCIGVTPVGPSSNPIRAKKICPSVRSIWTSNSLSLTHSCSPIPQSLPRPRRQCVVTIRRLRILCHHLPIFSKPRVFTLSEDPTFCSHMTTNDPGHLNTSECRLRSGKPAEFLSSE